MIKNDFKHLSNNLIRVNNDFLLGNSFNLEKLPGIGKKNYNDWLHLDLLPNTRIIIEPSIYGFSLVLEFDDGSLKRAISKYGKDTRNLIDLIDNIPQRIPLDKNIYIRGLVYIPQSKVGSNLSFKDYFIKQKELIYCAFQIINADLNHFSELSQLHKLGFIIPENECTKYNVNEIELFISLWRNGKLFAQYPTNGIIFKVNSRKLQKILGETNNHFNWATAIRS